MITADMQSSCDKLQEAKISDTHLICDSPYPHIPAVYVHKSRTIAILQNTKFKQRYLYSNSQALMRDRTSTGSSLSKLLCFFSWLVSSASGLNFAPQCCRVPDVPFEVQHAKDVVRCTLTGSDPGKGHIDFECKDDTIFRGVVQYHVHTNKFVYYLKNFSDRNLTSLTIYARCSDTYTGQSKGHTQGGIHCGGIVLGTQFTSEEMPGLNWTCDMFNQDVELVVWSYTLSRGTLEQCLKRPIGS